jgi:serine/threonine-protein phosphatase 2A regulatory subunit A
MISIAYVFLTSQDKSWRVRYMVANQLYELCEAVGTEPTRCSIFFLYVKNDSLT